MEISEDKIKKRENFWEWSLFHDQKRSMSRAVTEIVAHFGGDPRKIPEDFMYWESDERQLPCAERRGLWIIKYSELVSSRHKYTNIVNFGEPSMFLRNEIIKRLETPNEVVDCEECDNTSAGDWYGTLIYAIQLDGWVYVTYHRTFEYCQEEEE